MRTLAVLRAAWDARAELAGPARLADEAAFLPAALALRDTPLHPAPRRCAALLIALIALALAWSAIGRVDIVAVASGKLVVSDRSHAIQPLERAIVQRVAVRDGDRVAAGQTLVELDVTDPAADMAALDEQGLDASAAAWRASRLLRALQAWESRSSAHGRAASPASGPDETTLPDWPEVRARAAIELLRAEWADLRARLDRLAAEAARRHAERETALSAVARLSAMLKTAARREADLRALAGEGFASTHAWEDRRRERMGIEGELDTQRARSREADAALAETGAARLALLAEWRQRWWSQHNQAATRQAQVEAERGKALRREQLTRLSAPVDGTVQELAVYRPGAIVTEGQALMVVVPDDAPMTAEVMLDNKDIGFVRVGDAAAVKLAAFPFTRHGTIAATVTRVSPDAIDHEHLGPRFAVTLALATHDIDIDGTRVRLRPGMALEAEVRTGSRRVLEFLLSPLERVGNESLRER